MVACELRPADTFVDLGSGAGKAVLQAASEFHVRHACGVELAASRHRVAINAWEAAAADVRGRTQFIEGDVSDSSGVLQDASLIWLSNLCFGDELMEALATLVADAPAARIVAVLKPFPSGPPRGFVQDTIPVLCQMSWTKPSDGVNPPEPGHPCVVYRRAEKETEVTRDSSRAVGL